MHKDPVTPELREFVMNRDMHLWMLTKPQFDAVRHGIPTRVGCVAVMLDLTSGPCSGPLTLDHVKTEPMMGKRAPSDREHLVTICLGHHVNTSWATSNRPVLRWYLEKVNDLPNQGAPVP